MSKDFDPKSSRFNKDKLVAPALAIVVGLGVSACSKSAIESSEFRCDTKQVEVNNALSEELTEFMHELGDKKVTQDEIDMALFYTNFYNGKSNSDYSEGQQIKLYVCNGDPNSAPTKAPAS